MAGVVGAEVETSSAGPRASLSVAPWKPLGADLTWS